MKIVGLVSGGKDSTINLVKCIAEGHEVVALANLHPPLGDSSVQDELDSFCFQTVGHETIELYAKACNLPLFRREIRGTARCDTLQYVTTTSDEVEDLYELLKEVKTRIPEVQGVACGAILSDYQRTRVESVCSRLELQSFAFLWQENQRSLLQGMIRFGLQAVLIKVAAFGLTAEFLRKPIDSQLADRFDTLASTCELNVCGEGGEYETLTLDCPVLFRSGRIVLDETRVVQHSNSGDAAYLRIEKAHFEPKTCTYDDDDTKRRLEALCPSRTLTADLRAMVIGEPIDPSSINLTNGSIEARFAFQQAERESAQTDAEKQRISEQHALFGAGLLRDQPVSVFVDGDSFVCRVIGYNNSGELDASAVLDLSFDRLIETASAQLATPSTAVLSDLTNVFLYVRDMRRFADLNAVYTRRFAHSPPVRVCVESSLPNDVELLLFAAGVCEAARVAESSQTDSKKRARTRSDFERRAMHVQSVSNWAPANIGPYSQAVTLRCACVNESDDADDDLDEQSDASYSHVHRRVGAFAGQIGLQPASMSLFPSTEEDSLQLEIKLAFRNLQRVIQANSFDVRDVPLFLCYYSADVDDRSAQFQAAIAFRMRNTPVRFVKAARLPRGARFEWEACLATRIETADRTPVIDDVAASEMLTNMVVRVVEPRSGVHTAASFRWRIESRTFGERWIATTSDFSTVTMLRTSGLIELLVSSNAGSSSLADRDELDTVLDRFRQQLYGLASVLKSNLVVRLLHAESVSWMAYRLLERCAASERTTDESVRVFILPTPVVSVRRQLDEPSHANANSTLLLCAVLYSAC